MKIVSLVPSITELLADLGLDVEVNGITKFCVHPEHWLRKKTIIGGTKNIDIEKIRKIRPDLIIANKEENVKEQVEALTTGFEVLLTDVNNFDEALEMIVEVGSRTGKQFEAAAIANEITKKFSRSQFTESGTVAYLIWKKPMMTVGGDTFIDSMLQQAGFKNVFHNRERYPETTIEEIRRLNPEYIFLSSEPYPFAQKHVAELNPEFPSAKTVLVNGEMFSWYGSRMLKAADYFKTVT